MIQVPTNSPIFVIHEPLSFHNGIDGTAGVVRSLLRKNPLEGGVFVFRNKIGNSIRILYYGGSGFWNCNHRLSKGTYNKVWPKGGTVHEPSSVLLPQELYVLIWGADPRKVHFPEVWRQVA
jgi:transposase